MPHLGQTGVQGCLQQGGGVLGAQFQPGQSGPSAWRRPVAAPRAGPGARGSHGRRLVSTQPRGSGTAGAGSWPGKWRPQPSGAGTGPDRPRLSSGRPALGPGWPPPDGYATADRPPGWSGGRSQPPAAPVQTHAGHRHGRVEPPGVRPGRRPPRPRQHDGRPTPPGRWPGRRGRRGPRRSWSAAGPHRTPGRRCGHAGGPAAPRSWGRGPRTWPGTPPAMLRPPARGWWRRRRTSGPGTRRGRTDTARGRWPAHGCSRPPGPPTAWRCRPPPRRSPPRHRWRQQRTPGALLSSENGLEMRVGRKQVCDRRLREVRGRGYFLVRSDRQLWGAGVWREPWTADRRRHGWRAGAMG